MGSRFGDGLAGKGFQLAANRVCIQLHMTFQIDFIQGTFLMIGKPPNQRGLAHLPRPLKTSGLCAVIGAIAPGISLKYCPYCPLFQHNFCRKSGHCQVKHLRRLPNGDIHIIVL
jgi:hypothetical protein